MGHEDPAMTLRIYQRVMPSMQKAVRDVAESLFGGWLTPSLTDPAGRSDPSPQVVDWLSGRGGS